MAIGQWPMAFLIMRIAVCINSFPTLNQSWLIDQLVGLISRGHDVRIYATPLNTGEPVHPAVHQYGLMDRITYRPSRPDPRLPRFLKGVGVALAHLPRHPRAAIGSLNLFKYKWKVLSGDLPMTLAALARPREPVDVFHVHDGQMAYVMAALKQFGLVPEPMIVTFHGPDISRPAELLKHEHGRLAFQHARAFTVGSTFIRDKVLALPHAPPPERVHILPLGLNMGDFEFTERAQPPGDEPIHLISVGRVVELKGFEYAIRAVARLAPRYPRLRYTIVGHGGEHLGMLKRLATELGVADRVEFPGGLSRDKLFPYYRRSHIFTLPGVVMPDGQAEGQGVVLLEAQAFGLPVITTTAGGQPDCVAPPPPSWSPASNDTPHCSAFVVPPRDVDALADHLAWLLDHPDAWPVMSRHGRAFIEERFDNAKLLTRLEALYTEVAQNAPASPR